MPKVKVARQSTYVDMTAMCDVSFLLLTFFILTAKFKPSEIVQIAQPTSHAENAVKEDQVVFSIDKDGKTYMAISKPERKEQIINKLYEISKDKYGTLDEKTKSNFKKMEIVGVPVQAIRVLPSVSSEGLTELKEAGKMEGIPIDSTNNQLGDWIMAVRHVYAETDNMDKPPIAIKGDKESNIKSVKRVIEILKDKDVYSYKLITSLKGRKE